MKWSIVVNEKPSSPKSFKSKVNQWLILPEPFLADSCIATGWIATPPKPDAVYTSRNSVRCPCRLGYTHLHSKGAVPVPHLHPWGKEALWLLWPVPGVHLLKGATERLISAIVSADWKGEGKDPNPNPLRFFSLPPFTISLRFNNWTPGTGYSPRNTTQWPV